MSEGIKCKDLDEQPCGETVGCSWTPGDSGNGSCGCDGDKKYALKQVDGNCVLCSDDTVKIQPSDNVCACVATGATASYDNNVTTCKCDENKGFYNDTCVTCTDATVQIENNKCVCAEPKKEVKVDKETATCVDPTCEPGWYRENDICYMCPGGQKNASKNGTCTACDGETTISSLKRDECITADACKSIQNAEVADENTCVCQVGYHVTMSSDVTPKPICKLCSEVNEAFVSDIWNVGCMDKADCANVQNAELSTDGKKCVCKAGYVPNSPNYYNVKGGQELGYACTAVPSTASGAAITAIIIALLVVVAAATTAAIVAVRARKAQAAETEALTAENM